MADEFGTLADPRWRALNESGLACSCGERHVGLFPVNLSHPIGFPRNGDYEPDEALRMDGDFLSANYSVWQGKFFAMRMRLPLRIREADPWAFMFTVWASLNREDFEAYLDAKKRGTLKNNAYAQARLVNRLEVYPDTVRLLGSAFQQEDGGPPLLIIHGPQPDNQADHPLISDQKEGVTFDKALELFAAYGHEMRQSGTA
jgi:hypothetical protein